MKQWDLIAIIERGLRAENFDGLYHDAGDCACEVDQLAPCGEPSPWCVAGYRHDGCVPDCSSGGGCDFHIMPDPPEVKP